MSYLFRQSWKMAKKHNNIRLSLRVVHEYNFINEIDDVPIKREDGEIPAGFFFVK